MDYNFSEDLKAIREILGITQVEMAKRLGVQQVTLSRNESGKTTASEKLQEQVYNFAFENNIKLGRLKEMMSFQLQCEGRPLRCLRRCRRKSCGYAHSAERAGDLRCMRRQAL